MKEFEQQFSCSAERIAERIPVLQDRKHIKGNMELAEVFNAVSFKNRIASSLSPQELAYMQSLIKKASETFKTVTSLRIAFNSTQEILDPADESTKSDLIILKKLYGFQSSIPMRRN